MSTEKVEVDTCPVCGFEGFPNLSALIKHIQMHNNMDPEVEISVVAEREKILSDLFG